VSVDFRWCRQGQMMAATGVRHAMRLYLINPSNPLVSIVRVKDSRWKPLPRLEAGLASWFWRA